MRVTLTRTDEAAAALLVLLSVFVYLASESFPTGPTSAPGAAFFPRLIAAGLVLLAVVQFVTSLRNEEHTAHVVTRAGIGRVAIPVVLSVIFVFTMPIFGFLIGSVLFLLVLMRYSGVRSYRTLVPVSIAVSLVLYYVFVGFLMVPLPESAFLPISRLLPPLPLVVLRDGLPLVALRDGLPLVALRDGLPPVAGVII